MDAPALELRGLTKRLPSGERLLTILDRVDLAVAAGEFVAILGPSGSGKSTLLGLAAGLDRPSEGEVRIDGRPIQDLSEDELARLRRGRIGFVFQSFQLLPRLTALQNVELPMIYAGMAPTERKARARELLDRVGLGSRMGHRPTQLSGGQQQRVAIARSLANRPDLLLADEPTGALDTHTGEEVLKLFHELNGDGLTLAIVTHDPDVANEAHRRVAFRDGLIVSDERSGVAT